MGGLTWAWFRTNTHIHTITPEDSLHQSCCPHSYDVTVLGSFSIVFSSCVSTAIYQHHKRLNTCKHLDFNVFQNGVITGSDHSGVAHIRSEHLAVPFIPLACIIFFPVSFWQINYSVCLSDREMLVGGIMINTACTNNETSSQAKLFRHFQQSVKVKVLWLDYFLLSTRFEKQWFVECPVWPLPFSTADDQLIWTFCASTNALCIKCIWTALSKSSLKHFDCLFAHNDNWTNNLSLPKAPDTSTRYWFMVLQTASGSTSVGVWD